MNWTTWESSILSLMMWREARSEGELGMRAVGHVAMNRAIKKALSVAVVVCQDAQFTSINPYKKTYDPQLDVWPIPGDLTFKLAMRIAYEIVSGLSQDPTHGADHYWNPLTATSESFREEVANGKLVSVADIGQHQFYKRV